MNTAEQFWANTTLDPSTGCLNWAMSVKSNGYGQVSFRPLTGHGNSVTAHRIAWALAKNNGRMPPPGTVVHHRCENKRCVNPDHLQLLEDKTHRHLHAGTGCRIHGLADWKIRPPLPSGRNKGGVCRICDRDYQRVYQKFMYHKRCAEKLAAAGKVEEAAARLAYAQEIRGTVEWPAVIRAG